MEQERSCVEVVAGSGVHDPFDHDQRSASGQRVAAVAQNDLATIVFPIVQNALHQDRVGATRSSFKETAGNEPAAIGDAKSIKMRTRFWLAARKVESDTLDMWVVLQHTADQFAGAAAEIHDNARAREVVCQHDLWNDGPRQADHPRVEQAVPFRRIARRGIAIAAIAAQLGRALSRPNQSTSPLQDCASISPSNRTQSLKDGSAAPSSWRPRSVMANRSWPACVGQTKCRHANKQPSQCAFVSGDQPGSSSRRFRLVADGFGEIELRRRIDHCGDAMCLHEIMHGCRRAHVLPPVNAGFNRSGRSPLPPQSPSTGRIRMRSAGRNLP